MKSVKAWRLGMKGMHLLPGPRQRGHLKKPTWIIVLVSFVSFFLVCAYVYPPRSAAACYIFSSLGCKALEKWLPPAPARELTDDEITSRVVDYLLRSYGINFSRLMEEIEEEVDH